MKILRVVPQLRTTDLEDSVRFYTTRLNLTLDFRHQDFYAGITAGSQRFHLKRVDERDPWIDQVAKEGHFHLYFETDDVAAMAERVRSAGIAMERELHETPWGTSEFVIKDNQGHTLYFDSHSPG